MIRSFLDVHDTTFLGKYFVKNILDDMNTIRDPPRQSQVVLPSHTEIDLN